MNNKKELKLMLEKCEVSKERKRVGKREREGGGGGGGEKLKEGGGENDGL